VVWRVTDTAKAVFDVEDFEQFVVVQSETAVRHLAAQFPYDDCTDGAVSLRRNTDEVLEVLHNELRRRLEPAGIAVLGAQIEYLLTQEVRRAGRWPSGADRERAVRGAGKRNK
jgi:regulator of protease activity HflC (stomatin/prohibitin superfamily)